LELKKEEKIQIYIEILQINTEKLYISEQEYNAEMEMIAATFQWIRLGILWK